MNARTLLFLVVSPWPLLAAESKSPALEITADASSSLASLVKFDFPTFEIMKLDQKPVVQVRVAPQYPADMRRAQIEGEVLVDFVVTGEGKVEKISTVRSSHREFEAAAITAVSKWKFSPGKKSGRPVNTHMQVPIGFSLN